MRYIVSILLLMILTHTISAEEITTNNLLPNAGDGVDWGSSSTEMINDGGSSYVSNNSTHNGFTITCDTQVSNACGYAFSGELEASHDMTVTATGSLV